MTVQPPRTRMQLLRAAVPDVLADFSGEDAETAMAGPVRAALVELNGSDEAGAILASVWPLTRQPEWQWFGGYAVTHGLSLPAGHVWAIEPAETLDPGSVEALARQLESGDVVFGWQYHYRGGSSGTSFVWSGADELRRTLDGARPGDIITAYSLQLAQQFARPLAVLRTPTDAAAPIDEALLAELYGRLQAGNCEVVTVGHALGPGGSRAWMDSGYDYSADFRGDRARLDYDEECVQLWAKAAGQLTFFERDVVDVWHARDPWLLVDAKTPNDRGEIPLHGAY